MTEEETAQQSSRIFIDLDAEEDDPHHHPQGQQYQVEEEEEDYNFRERNAMMLKTELWLIRVPPDVHEQWKTVADGGSVGRLTLTQNSFQASAAGVPPEIEVSLALRDSVDSATSAKARGGRSPGTSANVGGGGNSASSAVFNNYKLIPVPVATMGSNNGLFVAHGTSSSSETEVVHVTGTIGKKFKAFPVRNEEYKAFMKRKKELVKLSQQTVQLERAVNCYKPVANHKHNIEYDKKKKLEGRKMRGEKEEVAQLLFHAFETHQFYSFKDLVKLTNQPASFLKEVLNEYCNYSTKGIHRSFWELKPEYRHYGEEDSQEVSTS